MRRQLERLTMKLIRALRYLILASSMFVTGHCSPQGRSTPKATGHPRIGLVLEGGGALGLAHIGVIKWLEEHRIPVSYVAGTSMGGLIGGIYSTGRSDAEVRQVVQTINWDEVLRAQTLFPDLAFRRKEDD